MYPLTPPVSLAFPSSWYSATPELSSNISVVDLVVEACVSPYRVVTSEEVKALLKTLIWSSLASKNL